MVADHFGDKWQKKLDDYQQANPPIQFVPMILPPVAPAVPQITPEEIQEFRELLERAREYDKKNSEPECELEEKKNRIRKLAEQLGVKIDFL